MSPQLANESFCQNGPGKAFCDNKGVVSQRFKEFAQYIRISRVSSHSLHLRLKLVCSDWFFPLISYELRFAQIIFDFSFDLRPRNHSIELRLGRTIFLRPNPMAPIDFFNRSLVGYALCKC